MFTLLAFLLFILQSALAAASTHHGRITPDAGSLVVDSTGAYPASYTSIPAAVSALQNTANAQTIFIFPGTYTGQVYIPALAGPLTIQGYTPDSRTYGSNTVTLTDNLSRLNPNLTSDDSTSTLRLWTTNVKLYNLNIANTFGSAPTNGQALALSAQNTNQGFYACAFTGWQDTIYANVGRQIYAKSYIAGAVDFIFGQKASAWFQDVDIETLGAGCITANGRDAANNTSFYVFNNANVTGTSGPDSMYLGRPWRQFSRVVFQESYLGDVIRPEGWSVWDNVQPVNNVFYREYENFGPGSNISQRANFSAQLTEPIQASDILGVGFETEVWVDETYL